MQRCAMRDGIERVYQCPAMSNFFMSGADVVRWEVTAADTAEHDVRGRAIPLIPAGAARERELFGGSGGSDRIVRLILEDQDIADAEVGPGVAALLDPYALAVRKEAGPRRRHVAAGVEPDDPVAGRVQAPFADVEIPRHPAPVGEVVRLGRVAVERVIHVVIDVGIVPVPALEAARVRVLDPADLLPVAIDELILRKAADARPERRVTDEVVEHVDAMTRGRRGSRLRRARAGGCAD